MIRQVYMSPWILVPMAGLLLFVPPGCDRLHEPVVYNALDSAVELRVEWEDGTVSSGTVPPREVVHIGRPDSSVRAVSVTKDGEGLISLSGKEIGELVMTIDRNAVGFAVQDGGVRGVTGEELKRLYAK